MQDSGSGSYRRAGLAATGLLARAVTPCDETEPAFWPANGRVSMSSELISKRPLAVAAATTVALVGTLAAAYVVSQFLRNSVGVIAPDLAAEIGMSAAEIGVLSSAFFIAFALAQLPLGVAIDRYGPKRAMLVCAAIAVLGAVVFARSTTAGGLVAARVLMGVGSSCFLMAPLALYAQRFPPERFTMLAGIQIGIGSLGTLLVTAPLAWAAATIGWRAAFLWVGAIMVMCGVLIAVAVRDANGSAPAGRRESVRESLAGILEAARTESVARLFAMNLICYSGFALIVGLWGGPYLTHAYGYGLTARGDLLVIPAVTQVVGVVLWGHADRLLGGFKPPVLLGSVATAAALFVLAGAGTLAPVPLIVWLALFGFATAYTPVLIAHGKTLFPPHLVGRGMTLLNIGTMGGVFLSQLATGAVIDLFPAEGGVYPVDAYRLAFALQGAVTLAACAAYLGARDPTRGEDG